MEEKKTVVDHVLVVLFLGLVSEVFTLHPWRGYGY